jgi:hypothetical protein
MSEYSGETEELNPDKPRRKPGSAIGSGMGTTEHLGPVEPVIDPNRPKSVPLNSDVPQERPKR